jgi:hypothetical protein
MAFSSGTIVPEDLEEVGAVIFRAYRGENTYINAAYPDNLTKKGQEAGLQKLRKFTETSERARWEKVYDETTGKIVGVAVWLIYEHEKPANTSNPQQSSDQEFESEDAEWVAGLRRSFAELQVPFWQKNDLPLISTYATTTFRSAGANATHRSLCYDSGTRIPVSRSRQHVDEVWNTVCRQDWCKGALLLYYTRILQY